MAGKNGKKIVHHTYMSAKEAHYVGELVNGARIVVQWGDVGTELMVCVDGDISLFLGYENIRFTAPVYVGDFMEYTGEIIDIGKINTRALLPCLVAALTAKLVPWKVGTQMKHVKDADVSNIACLETAATACEPPILCAEAIGSLYIAKKDQRGPTESSFAQREHRK